MNTLTGWEVGITALEDDTTDADREQQAHYDALEHDWDLYVAEQELIADDIAAALEEEAGCEYYGDQGLYANPHYDFPNPHSDL